jgi:hypothetical protein
VRLLKKTHLIIPVILLVLQAVFLLPTLFDILMEPPEGDEILLCVLLAFLTLASLFSFTLWKSPDSVNGSRLIYCVLVVFLVLLAMLTTAFTYASWILLAVTFFIFYIWIRKTLNRSIGAYRSIILFSIYLLLIHLFVITQLNP